MTVRKWAPARLVNTTSLNDQSDPSIATLADGGYIVVWRSADLIRSQRYDAAGGRVGAEFVVDNDPGNRDPSVTGLSNGGFVISYTDPLGMDLSNTDVDALLYDSNGALVALPGLDGGAGNQQQSELTRNGTGYAAVYTNYNSTSGDIVLKRFDAAGALQNVVAVNNTVTAGIQEFGAIVELTGGYLAVAWSSTSAGYDVRLRVFNAAGAAVTLNEVVANTTALQGSASVPQITALANGGFVVTWYSFQDVYPGDGVDARARIFSRLGEPVGADFLLNTTTAGTQAASQVAGLASGGFVAVWLHNGGSVRGQAFDAFGARVGAEFVVDTGTYVFSEDVAQLGVTGLADGRFVVTWNNSDGSGSGVWSQIFDPRDGVVNGDSGANLLYGNNGLNDEISGYDGADTLNDLDGADSLYGGLGGDTYVVGAGDRIFETVAGGIDLVLASASFALGDNLENLTLTGAATSNGTGNGLANRIIGNDAKNTLSGLDGNDTLLGSGGRDILIGGIGRDILTGGGGKDWFDFNATTETGKTASTRDIITDFAHGTDKIDLSTIDGNGSASGNGKFKFVAAEGAAFTGVRGQLIWDQKNAAGVTNDKTIVFGDIDGDRRADFTIELTGLKALTANDFVL